MKLKVTLGALAIATALSMTGCTTTMGNERVNTIPASVIQQTIVLGKSTKQDVIKLMGEPQADSTSDDLEFITYSYGKSTIDPKTFIPVVGQFIGGATSQTKTVVFTLNKVGKVTKIDFGSGGSTMHGI